MPEQMTTHAENLFYNKAAREALLRNRRPPKLVMFRATYCGRRIGPRPNDGWVPEHLLFEMDASCEKCLSLMVVFAIQALSDDAERRLFGDDS